MMTSGLRRKYNAHIQSSKWRNMRRERLAATGHRCERCGRLNVRLCLHHKTYARFGRELPNDVLLLCCQCHRPADQKRRAMTPRSKPLTIEDFRTFEGQSCLPDYRIAQRSQYDVGDFRHLIRRMIPDLKKYGLGHCFSDEHKGERQYYPTVAQAIYFVAWSNAPNAKKVVAELAIMGAAFHGRGEIIGPSTDALLAPPDKPTIRYDGNIVHITPSPIAEPIQGELFATDLLAENDLPVIDPLREEAELEAELRKYNSEFGYETQLPKGLVAIDEKQRRAYLDAWRKHHHNNPNQLFESEESEGIQVCYGSDGRLVEYEVCRGPGGTLVRRWPV
jgi:hypothetical protein